MAIDLQIIKANIDNNPELKRVIVALSCSNSLGIMEADLLRKAGIEDRDRFLTTLATLDKLGIIQVRYIQIGTGGTTGLFIRLQGVNVVVTVTES